MNIFSGLVPNARGAFYIFCFGTLNEYIPCYFILCIMFILKYLFYNMIEIGCIKVSYKEFNNKEMNITFLRVQLLVSFSHANV